MAKKTKSKTKKTKKSTWKKLANFLGKFSGFAGDIAARTENVRSYLHGNLDLGDLGFSLTGPSKPSRRRKTKKKSSR